MHHYKNNANSFVLLFGEMNVKLGMANMNPIIAAQFNYALTRLTNITFKLLIRKKGIIIWYL